MAAKRATLIHAPECAISAIPRGVCSCHLALRPAQKVELDLSDFEELGDIDLLFDGILEQPTPVVALDGTDLTQSPTRPGALFMGFEKDQDGGEIALYEWPG